MTFEVIPVTVDGGRGLPLTEYAVQINGHDTTLLLDDDDAERWGVKPAECELESEPHDALPRKAPRRPAK